MANLKNGRKFSAEFNKATEVNRQTRLLAQTPNEPVEYVDLEQVAEVVNEGMATQADLNTTNENVATNAGNIQTLQNEVGNRYTKAETDAEINEAINEVEQTIEKIEQTNKDTYATKTGKYKKLTAGFAYEILGDGQATSEQFSFRPTGGPNRNVRDGSARIEVLKGNSVVWNQGIKPSSTQATEGGLTGYYADGKWNWSGTATKAAAALLPKQSWGKGIAGHKVIMLVGGNYNFDLLGVVSYTTNGNETFQINKIYTLQNDSSDIEPVAQLTIGNTYQANISVHFIDLTLMFGAGNEPATVEQFYELLPEGADINAYNEGEIVDANYKAIKTTGFNQWDEQWEVGGIDGSYGQDVPNSDAIRSKGYIRVISGLKYNIKCPTQVILCAYDSDYNYITYLLWGGSTTNFTIPSNAKYIRFCTYSTFYGATYNNDICINIAWDEYSALNGQYKPYKPFERDLSWANKYFPATINGKTKYGMRRAGNVADEIRFNSTTQQWEAVQRVGVVDLGSLYWNEDTTFGGFFAAIPNVKLVFTATCSKYTFINSYLNLSDKSCCCVYQDALLVKDSSYTDAAAFKAAMAGVMLNYELATPIATPITEDVNLAYDVADYGTEQLIVADGAQSAPLSAEIVYENNASMLLKQIALALDRLDAIEAILATMQASAVATINEE